MNRMEIVTDQQTLERLNRALNIAFVSKGITKKRDMAAYIEYESPTFSNIINGKLSLSDKFLRTINEKLGISIRFVKYGEGDMFLRTDGDGHQDTTETQIATLIRVVASQQETIERLTEMINDRL